MATSADASRPFPGPPKTRPHPARRHRHRRIPHVVTEEGGLYWPRTQTGRYKQPHNWRDPRCRRRDDFSSGLPQHKTIDAKAPDGRILWAISRPPSTDICDVALALPIPPVAIFYRKRGHWPIFDAIFARPNSYLMIQLGAKGYFLTTAL